MRQPPAMHTGERDPDARTGVALSDLVIAVGDPVVRLAHAPEREILVSTVALLDEADLAVDLGARSAPADLCLLAGVPGRGALDWFDDLARRDVTGRPAAVMTKIGPDAAALLDRARRVGLALVSVDPRARWDHVFSLVHRLLARTHPAPGEAAGIGTAASDLFELARMVAHNTGGLVSIEDAHSQLLAYSPADESADELRILSILGRQCPPAYLQVLTQWGVFDRIRSTDEIVDVPAHPQLGTRRRLVVGIREPVAGFAGRPRPLGAIWVQESNRPFAADTHEVLRGAAAVAARTIAGRLRAPSTESLLIRRLFGAGGGRMDAPSVAEALQLPDGQPATVIGFAAHPAAGAGLSAVGPRLQLHASAYRPDALAAVIGNRAYVLLPGAGSPARVTAWTRQLVDRLEAQHPIRLRAAIAGPIPHFGQVAAARAEVDRVLDGTADAFPDGRVTTLAESLTAVLLSEVADLLNGHPLLADPRLAALTDYDRDHGAQLQESLQAYLDAHGDVRTAATALLVHPNTVRYRVRRAAQIMGVDLDDPADRLLVELQLACRRRRTG